MSRYRGVALLTVGLVLALLALWMAGGGIPGAGNSGAPTGSGPRYATLQAQLRALDIVALRGAAPPGVELSTLDGRRLSLADFSGQPALLYFWATW